MHILSWFKRLFRGSNSSLFPVMQEGTYLELRSEDGATNGSIILCHTRVARERFLESLTSNQISSTRQSSSFPQFILDQLGPTGASIMSGLKAGKLYEIVDPLTHRPINTAYELMKSQSNGISLGTIINRLTGRIVGPAGLKNANIALVIAPDVIFQVIHFVAGVQLMHSIDHRLAQLQRSIESLIQHHQAASYGRLSAAVEFLDDIESQYSGIGRFTPDMATRLIIAERDLRMVLGEKRMLLAPFIERSKQLLGEEKSVGVMVEGDRLLEDNLGEYLHDSVVLIEATRAKIRLNRMWIAHDVEHVRDYVPAKIEQFNQCLEDCTAITDQLGRIAELKIYVADCAKSLRWHQKLVRPRVVYRSMERVADHEAESSVDLVAPSYFIWADDSGRINGCVGLPMESEI